MVALCYLSSQATTLKQTMELYTVNCKPNELAVIVRQSVYGPLLGKVVTTLYVAPNCEFKLPDGFRQNALEPNSKYRTWWVVEFPNLIDAPCTSGSRKTRYGCVPDAVMRPIRDNDGTDEMIRIAGLPNKEPSNV